MEPAELQPLSVANNAALNRAVARRAFSRPAILDATRAVGFSDSELARRICSPAADIAHYSPPVVFGKPNQFSLDRVALGLR
jgi:hypothetical protein